jgi:hypothetical protein
VAVDEWDAPEWMEWGLSSATLKLGRAYQHLDSIDAEVREFFEVDPYVVTCEADMETGERLMRVAAVDEPPIELSFLIGDCLHNLRSALDHLVWERSAPQKRGRSTGFPLRSRRPKGPFAGLAKVRGLSPRDRAIVQRLQPYNARDKEQVPDEPLLVLHNLNVDDKHKFLHVTGLSMEGATLRPVAPGARIRHAETFPGTFEHGAVLARVVVSPPEAKVDMNFRPAFDVAFEPGTTPWHDLPIGHTLEILAGAVEDALRAFRWV